ncbi:Spy/CpxP family protein refolding chaperone [Phenylobacterium sp.]|uniref:Spy/CpxP family protein refolding chaperone n=1 Tax=Phenylobacterium sp. TaxID=1871053 RepID=UPI0025CF8A08|nr:Spy/CpxP family protein refolding chaperone [Phenylobacterium sp.]
MNRRLLLALAPAALALATVASAQAPGHPPGGAPTMMHGGPPPEMAAMHEAMMKQHLEDLKTVLRLRPDQEAALQAFVAAHHPDGGPMMMHEGHDPMHDGAMHDSAMHDGPSKPMTTPERLDDMARHEAAMAAEHDKMRQALTRFYAALSPDQQKVFDALMRLQGPGHGGHMGMGGPMGEHGGMRRIEMHRTIGGPPGHDPD